jgi:hypothetical protein
MINYGKKMTQIFCDLDGVIFDFEGGFLKSFGMEHNSIPESEMWDMIFNHTEWWANLHMMPDAIELWNYIKPYHPAILTGCPLTGYDKAVEGKNIAVDNHLGEHIEVFTCRSKNKPDFMKNKNDILIDDMVKNIKRWEKAGGIGILHISAANTILELKKLGFS